VGSAAWPTRSCIVPHILVSPLPMLLPIFSGPFSLNLNFGSSIEKPELLPKRRDSSPTSARPSSPLHLKDHRDEVPSSVYTEFQTTTPQNVHRFYSVDLENQHRTST
jgi:hypothetical protein